jgi:hypothetical protein
LRNFLLYISKIVFFGHTVYLHTLKFVSALRQSKRVTVITRVVR